MTAHTHPSRSEPEGCARCLEGRNEELRASLDRVTAENAELRDCLTRLYRAVVTANELAESGHTSAKLLLHSVLTAHGERTDRLLARDEIPEDL